jgi:hypothetical protein
MYYIDLKTATNHIKLTSSYITNVERISYDDKKTNLRKNIKRKCLNGDVYDGEIDSGNGKFDGNGKMMFANKEEYTGEWKDGKMHGNGKMMFANKEEYTGEWKDGKMHGNGKIVFHDGSYFQGVFDNGNPVNGLYDRGDGVVYQGKVAQNYAPFGNGTMKYPNHLEESGFFKDGILLNGVRDFYNPENIDAFEQAKLKLQGVTRRIERGEFSMIG